MREVNLRHNRIVRLFGKFLDKYLKPRDNWEIIIENPALHHMQNRIPDIQLKNVLRKTLFIIDIKSPYDKVKNMEGCRVRYLKIKYYKLYNGQVFVLIFRLTQLATIRKFSESFPDSIQFRNLKNIYLNKFCPQ